jgi:hypothetical protein
MKKEATPKKQGAKKKDIRGKKEATPKMQGVEKM